MAHREKLSPALFENRLDVQCQTRRTVLLRVLGGPAVGGGGTVYGRGADGWTQQSTPTGQNLTAVVRDATDIAVGAGGAILER
ncbi:hypothetical protein [Haloarcula marina]|uniref:hypothetical protein n=1 Tax=Haloarcula marina TaxID=2961574 RepID=UPI0020B78836|nr:hypothetical protein [Halomicroarcula marina]